MRGMVLVRRPEDLARTLEELHDMGFVPFEEYELNPETGRSSCTPVPDDRVALEHASTLWEIRFSHPDGSLVRLFPRGGDGMLRLCEYLPETGK